MSKLDFISAELKKLKEEGRYMNIRALSSAQGAWVNIGEDRVLNLTSNNYLGLANDPRIKEAAKRAIDEYGIGAGAVRTIAGTMDIHLELEEKLAKFKHAEACILLQSGLCANLGTIPAIVGNGDIIFTEELNHASIIDACRLSKARKVVYPHLDAGKLGEIMKSELGDENKNNKLIVTDGVFSMDGDLAPLPELAELGEKYGAMVMVDDAHGEGVLGDHGRGMVDHFNLYGKVDIEMGTLSKAFGVVGGYISGSEELIEYLKQKARPFLFSSAVNPGDVAAVMAAIDILESSDELVKRLWENTRYLKERLKAMGFDIGNSKTPITPVMLGDEHTATEASARLFKEERIFAQPIVYPTVARGTARLRLEPSAIHSKEDLNYAIEGIERVGKALGAI